MVELASKAQLQRSFIRITVVSVAITLTLGLMAGKLGSPDAWYQALAKPGFIPPPVAFAIVWPILYTLMGLSVAMVWHANGHPRRGLAIGLFALQFVCNLAWTPIFFHFHHIMLGWLWIALILLGAAATTWVFRTVRPVAAVLMLPYLAWLVLAFAVNFSIWRLNPAADSAPGTRPDEQQDVALRIK